MAVALQFNLVFEPLCGVDFNRSVSLGLQTLESVVTVVALYETSFLVVAYSDGPSNLRITEWF